MKNALVLSGGSVKGCFQAGAVLAVFESGFMPDIIYGISVGSLNGSFITNAAGKLYKAKGKLNANDWVTIGQQLRDFWFSEIKKPNDVAIQRSAVVDVWDILWNKFEGLSDTTPINSKVDAILDIPTMVQAPVKLHVGAVDFLSTTLLFSSPGDPDFISCLKGSIAIPIAMPPSISQKGEVLFDGGTRDVAPLGHAINIGAENIIGILCQSADLTPVNEGKAFSEKNLMDLANRIEDIIVNQNVKNDSEWITFLNSLLTEVKEKNYTLNTLEGYKLIKHLIIQPANELTINITSFTSADIQNNFNLGYQTAKEKLAGYIA